MDSKPEQTMADVFRKPKEPETIQVKLFRTMAWVVSYLLFAVLGFATIWVLQNFLTREQFVFGLSFVVVLILIWAAWDFAKWMQKPFDR